MTRGEQGTGKSEFRLAQFWDCLDRRQKEALLIFTPEEALSNVPCTSCKRLLSCAISFMEGEIESNKASANKRLALQLTPTRLLEKAEGVRPPPAGEPDTRGIDVQAAGAAAGMAYKRWTDATPPEDSELPYFRRLREDAYLTLLRWGGGGKGKHGQGPGTGNGPGGGEQQGGEGGHGSSGSGSGGGRGRGDRSSSSSSSSSSSHGSGGGDIPQGGGTQGAVFDADAEEARPGGKGADGTIVTLSKQRGGRRDTSRETSPPSGFPSGPSSDDGLFLEMHGGHIELCQSASLDRSMRALSALDEETVLAHTARAACVCSSKVDLRFVDMLTYPRPVRKFNLLLSKSMPMGVLRKLMAAEVCLEGVDALVLVLRGKPIPRGVEEDRRSLENMGFRSGQLIGISRTLGDTVEQNQGEQDKNRQFVGDLLFGHSVTSAGGAAGGAGGSGAKKGDSSSSSSSPPPPTVIGTFEASHGFQILGDRLDSWAHCRVVEAWRLEVDARKHEAALLADLEAEEEGGEGGEAGRRNRNKKKKDKQKKRKEDAKRKQEQIEEDKLAERRVKQERAEARNMEEKQRKAQRDAEEREREEANWKEQEEERRAAQLILQQQQLVLQKQEQEREKKRQAEAKAKAKKQKQKERRAATALAAMEAEAAEKRRQAEILAAQQKAQAQAQAQAALLAKQKQQQQQQQLLIQQRLAKQKLQAAQQQQQQQQQRKGQQGQQLAQHHLASTTGMLRGGRMAASQGGSQSVSPAAVKASSQYPMSSHQQPQPQPQPLVVQQSEKREAPSSSSAAAKYCPSCGAVVVSAAARFCAYCGGQVVFTAPQQPAKAASPVAPPKPQAQHPHQHQHQPPRQPIGKKKGIDPNPKGVSVSPPPGVGEGVGMGVGALAAALLPPPPSQGTAAAGVGGGRSLSTPDLSLKNQLQEELVMVDMVKYLNLDGEGGNESSTEAAGAVNKGTLGGLGGLNQGGLHVQTQHLPPAQQPLGSVGGAEGPDSHSDLLSSFFTTLHEGPSPLQPSAVGAGTQSGGTQSLFSSVASASPVGSSRAHSLSASSPGRGGLLSPGLGGVGVLGNHAQTPPVGTPGFAAPGLAGLVGGGQAGLLQSSSLSSLSSLAPHIPAQPQQPPVQPQQQPPQQPSQEEPYILPLLAHLRGEQAHTQTLEQQQEQQRQDKALSDAVLSFVLW